MEDNTPDMARTLPSKELMTAFVNYMAQTQPEKWQALVESTQEAEASLRDSFNKTWGGHISAYLERMIEAGTIPVSHRMELARLMPALTSNISVSLLPTQDFFGGAPSPRVDIHIRYGAYRMQKTLTTGEFENYGVEALKACVQELEQRLKLRIGA